MTQESYSAWLKFGWILTHLACLVPARDMLDAIDHAHAAGPFIDPTAYRQAVARMGEDAAMLRELARLRETVADLARPHPGLVEPLGLIMLGRLAGLDAEFVRVWQLAIERRAAAEEIPA